MGTGLRIPKRIPLGTDMSGTVEALGGAVTRFKRGDEVFGETIRSHQWKSGGACAEYVAVREQALELKPANVSFELAASADVGIHRPPDGCGATSTFSPASAAGERGRRWRRLDDA